MATVLIVEDEAPIREFVAEEFEVAGYTAVIANTGARGSIEGSERLSQAERPLCAASGTSGHHSRAAPRRGSSHQRFTRRSVADDRCGHDWAGSSTSRKRQTQNSRADNRTALGQCAGYTDGVESGMPDLKFEGWFSLFAPKATPDSIIGRLAEATHKVMSDASLLETYRAEGLEPDIDSSPDKAQLLVQDGIERLTPLIKSIQLKLE